MVPLTHKVGFWLFKGPLKSRHIHRVARAYCNVYNHNPANQCESEVNGEYDLLEQIIPQTSVVFDVGANIGEWTEEALGLNPDLTVHAFEPSAGALAQFRARGFDGRVTLNPCGLSDQPEQRILVNYGEGSGLNSLYRRADLEARNSSMKAVEEPIELRTLDGYCEEKNIEHIDFLKIDVEGHELAILRGAGRLLNEQRIGAIQVEYGASFQIANTLLRDIFDIVKPAGMIGGQIEPGRVTRHDRYHAKLENFLLSNWVFAHPDHPYLWG